MVPLAPTNLRSDSSAVNRLIDLVATTRNTILASRAAECLQDIPNAVDSKLVRSMLEIVVRAERTVRMQEERIAQLEALSVTDELTGIFNRRGFKQNLDRELQLARRGDTQGLLMMIDLDEFKWINDTYGHAAGDALLRETARRLQGAVRSTDIAARLGGDEFAVVLPNCAPADAPGRIESLRQILDNIEIRWCGHHLVVQASLGFAAFDGSQPSDVVQHQADISLYQSKTRSKRGRPAAPALDIVPAAGEVAAE